jgi:hypothetical protein
MKAQRCAGRAMVSVMAMEMDLSISGFLHLVDTKAHQAVPVAHLQHDGSLSQAC